MYTVTDPSILRRADFFREALPVPKQNSVDQFYLIVPKVSLCVIYSIVLEWRDWTNSSPAGHSR